jgi:glycosyltransferase involved in cell wall biosynthesis
MNASFPAEAPAGLHPSKPAKRSSEAFAPAVAILTGGGDRPYALGLAGSLLARSVPFHFIGSDDLDSPELHDNPLVRFLNLRGDQSPEAPVLRKIGRVLTYYVRLVCYAATSPAPVFHVLWNNKLEYFDRTLLTLFYRLCGKRIVFTVHNVNIRQRDGRDSWLNRWTLRFQYQLVFHLFVHTERMKRDLQQDFGLDGTKITVIPFGINGSVPDTDLTREQARERLRLRPDDKVVLFFGNIAPYKGLEDLVTAFEQLIPTNPKLRLIIAGRPKGEAAYWANIERRLAVPPLNARVLMRIEFVPDADTEIYFKAADVLALPYRRIFQSGVLFLAYNFGLPVVAADVGAIREDIVEGQTGYIYPANDATGLAACLERYFSGDLFRDLERHRREIRDIAESRHSWERVARLTEAIYQQTITESERKEPHYRES